MTEMVEDLATKLVASLDNLAAQVDAINKRGQQHFEDYKRLFEQLPGMYVLIDVGGTTVAASNDYLTYTYVTREQLIGKPLLPEFPEREDNGSYSKLSASLQRVRDTKVRDALPALQWDVRDSDGKWLIRWWKLSSAPVLDADGVLIYIVINVTDVTGASGGKTDAC